MGAIIVRVIGPQEKADAKGGNLPGLSRDRRRRGRRGGSRLSRPRAESRKQAMVKPVPVREVRRRVDDPATRTGPTRKGTRSTRDARAKERFMAWVERRVKVVKANLDFGTTEQLRKAWYERDFESPPYYCDHRGACREKNKDRPDIRLLIRYRAHIMAKRLVARLTECKGRPPGGRLYVDRILRLKLSNWGPLLGLDYDECWSYSSAFLPPRGQVAKPPLCVICGTVLRYGVRFPDLCNYHAVRLPGSNDPSYTGRVVGRPPRGFAFGNPRSNPTERER